MIIFTDGGKFPATKEMIGFPQVTKILSKFSLRTKIKVNISTKLYRFPPIRQDSWTGRKSCESKGGVVSPDDFFGLKLLFKIFCCKGGNSNWNFKMIQFSDKGEVPSFSFNIYNKICRLDEDLESDNNHKNWEQIFLEIHKF